MNLRCVIVPVCLLLLFGSAAGYAQFFSQKKMYVVAPSGLRMRDKEGQTGKVVTVIPYGTEVVYLSQGKGEEIGGRYGIWYKIKWNGKTGWAFGAFLTEEKPLPNKYNFTTLAGYYEFVYQLPEGQIFITYEEKERRSLSSSLTLMPDSSFRMGITDHMYCPKDLSGKYTIKGNTITLVVDSVSSDDGSDYYSSFDPPVRIQAEIISANSIGVSVVQDGKELRSILADMHLLEIAGLEEIKTGSIVFNRTETKTYKYGCENH